ncbi:MAG: hypothetical protein ACYC09_00945 [Bacteroidota bacterium]
MKTSFAAIVLMLLLATLVPNTTASQDRRKVIISSRVGAEIDSSEAVIYNIFRSIKN